jgi:hypothetical protein
LPGEIIGYLAADSIDYLVEDLMIRDSNIKPHHELVRFTTRGLSDRFETIASIHSARKGSRDSRFKIYRFLTGPASSPLDFEGESREEERKIDQP